MTKKNDNVMERCNYNCYGNSNVGDKGFSLRGKGCDLLYVNEDENFMSIKLVEEIDGAQVSLEMASVCPEGSHGALSYFLDKEIEIIIKSV